MDLQELKFRVDTKELDDAVTKVGQLGDAVSKINSPVSELAKNTKNAAKGADELSAAASKTSSSTKDLGDNTDAVNARLQKLKDQLAFLRNDLNLSETGLTKMQAGLLASMKAIGATDAQLKQFASTFDQFNRLMGEQALDKSVAGLSMLNRQLREFEITNQLAAKGFNLTSTQIKQLSRDIEALRQQNEAFGRSADDGIDQLVNKYVATANAVNKYIASAKEAEQAAKREAQAAIAAAKAKEEHNATIEKQYSLVRQSAWREYAASIGRQSEEMQKLTAYYREQERAAEALDAQRINEAAKANQYLTRETEKLVFINEKLAQGFSVASANALFKYQEALLKTGRTADQVEKELRDLGAELMKKQGTSPVSTMQKDIQRLDQSVNHLARNIGVQFTDIFVSIANGQSVFQVITQQGGQLADAFLLAGISGKHMTNQLVEGAKSVFASYKVLVSALLDLGGRAIKGAGEAVVNFASNITGTDLVLNTFKRSLASLGEEGFQYIGVINKIGEAVKVFAGIVVSTAVVAVGALIAAFVQLSNEQDTLAKSLARYGANFGATVENAAELSRSLVDVGVKSSDAVTVIAEMAKAGNLGKESFEGITVAAVNAQKYVGIAVTDTVKHFSELVKDPVKILTEFGKQTGFVSQEQIKLVQDLIKVGATADATKEAIRLLENGYLQMASSAKENTSAIGLAMINLKSAISDVWNEFKNSSAVIAAIEYVSYSIRGLGAFIALAVTGAKSLVAALVAQKNIVFDPLNAKKHFSDFTKSLENYQKEYENTIEVLSAKKPTTDVLSPVQRAANVEAIAQAERLAQIQREVVGTVQSRAKELSKEAYVQERLNEIMKGYAVNSLEGLKVFSQARLKAEKEWEDANKSSTQKAINGTEKLDNQYKKILESFVKITSESEDYNDQLTKAQVKLNEILRSDTWKKLSDEQKTSVFLEYERAHAAELVKKKVQEEIQEREKLRQENFKYLNELENAYEGLTKDIDNQRKNLEKSSEDLKFQFDLIGKSAKEQELLTREYERQKKIKEAELKLEEQLVKIRQLEASGLYAEEAKKEREKAEKNFAETVRQINQETALKAAQDYQKAFEGIQNTITDIIATAIFEGGGAGSRKLKDFLKAEFRSFVINVLINPIVKGGMNAILGIIGTGGNIGSVISEGVSSYFSNTAIGTGGFLGNIGSVISKGISSYFNNTAIGALLSSPVGYAAAIGGGSIAAGSQAAMLAAQTGQFGIAGTALTAQAAGGVAGSIAGGAKSAVGSIAAAAPYLAAGAVVLNALGAFRSKKIVGGGLTGTLGEGDIKSYDLQRKGGSLFSGPKYSIKNVQTSPMSKALQDTFDSMRKASAKMAEQFGIAGDRFLTFTTRFGDDLIHPDTGGYGVKFDGLNEQQRQEAIQKALAQANDRLSLEVLRSAALAEMSKSTDPRTAKQRSADEYINQFAKEGETSTQTLVRLASSLQAVNSTFKALGLTLQEASLSGANTASALVDQFGGLEKFSESTKRYYDLFYTENEKLANSFSNMAEAFDKLGVAMPSSIQAYRDLVSAQDLATESGRETYTQLIQLAPAFSQMMGTITESIGVTTQSLSSMFSSVLEQATSAEEAFMLAQKNFQKMIGDALLNTVISTVSEAMISSIIGPIAMQMTTSMMTASTVLTTGATIAGSTVAVGGEIAANSIAIGGGVAAGTLAAGADYAGSSIASGGGSAAGSLAAGGAAAASAMVGGGSAVGGILTSEIEEVDTKVNTAISRVDAAIASISSYISNVTTILSDERIQSSIVNMSSAVGNIASSLFHAAPSISLSGGSKAGPLKDAYDLLVKTISKEKQLAKERLDSILDIYNASKNAAKDLFNEVKSTQKMAVADAKLFFTDSVTGILQGVMPDAKKYQDAVNTLVDNVRNGLYASKIDAERARLLLANELQAVADQLEPEKTKLETQIEYLDNLAKTAERQYDELKGVRDGVESLNAAIARWAAASGFTLPAYAGGGYYPGGLALVGEKGPEIINFSNPGMVYTAAQTSNIIRSSDNSEELAAIRSELVMLRAEVRADVSHNAKTAKLLNRVIQDGQSISVTQVTP